MRKLFPNLAAAAALLALCGQSPAPDADPWCTRIPLPRADLPALRSNVDTQMIHQPRKMECRPLDVRAGRTTLHLAVAATEAQREHGLMNVPFLPAGQGMLFAFPGGDQMRGFWMKDTITPLDMVFVKSDGTISAIAVNVPATAPKTTDDKIARREGLAKYVIELGAGEAGRLGLLPGAQLYILPVAAK